MLSRRRIFLLQTILLLHFYIPFGLAGEHHIDDGCKRSPFGIIALVADYSPEGPMLEDDAEPNGGLCMICVFPGYQIFAPKLGNRIRVTQ